MAELLSPFLWSALETDFNTPSLTSAARASVSVDEFFWASSRLAWPNTWGQAARAAAKSCSSTGWGILPFASLLLWSTHSPYGSGFSIGSLVLWPARSRWVSEGCHSVAFDVNRTVKT